MHVVYSLLRSGVSRYRFTTVLTALHDDTITNQRFLDGIPDTPAAPARFARRTKDWSKEKKAAPCGLLLKCIASASSMPCVVSARAAATDGSSSTCTFLRPSNLVKASQITLSSNPYKLPRTQPVS